MAKEKPISADTERKQPLANNQPGYTVLARRYRPQNFEELVGQEPVARGLVNALTSDRVAHAYLFTGARGVGKTSTARILAKALNCVQGPTAKPCGVCDPCREITAGEDVDVIELDAASNNGVEEIRNIRNNVQYLPSRDRYKIYIIDEIHMLSKQAFNALLKTLEEPPPHVKFIFATTDAHKIPVTILSRCQRFDLSGIALPQIVERLTAIVKAEGLHADSDALEMIARRAGGSMRDAQSLLDQLLAFGGDRLTSDQVHQLLGTAGDEHVLGIVDAVLAGDAGRALQRLDAASLDGFQPGELVDQLMAYWRDLMVVSVAGDAATDLSVPQAQRSALVGQVKSIHLDAILAGLDLLSTTRSRLKFSGHARTLVEMALVRLSRLRDLIPLAQLIQLLGQARIDVPAPRALPQPAGASPVALPESVKKKSMTEANGTANGQAVPLTPQTLESVWSQVLQGIGTLLRSELEKAGIPAIFGPNTLVIRFPARYTHAREHCQRSDPVERIEQALRKLTDQRWLVRVEGAPDTEAPAAAKRP